MALMAAMTAPDVFAASVSGAPVTDWKLYDTHYTERFLETPATNASGYDASSVLRHVRDLRAPLLVIHGMADDNVLFAHSTKLFKQLQDAGKSFDVMVYPGSKHSLMRQAVTGPHGYAMVKRFLDEHLKR
jgi:dipeptidyl-peptidase 4